MSAASRIRTIAIPAFCFLYLSVQLILGVTGLSKPGRSRFAWGMFAADALVPAFDIVYANSAVERDAGRRFITLGRPEVDYKTLLPPYICASIPSAVTIDVEHSIYRCPQRQH